MSAYVARVDRLTGSILNAGYVFPDTQMSESSAEAVWMNSVNTDPTVGYIVLDSETSYDKEAVLDRVYKAEMKDTFLINKVKSLS